MNEWNIFGMPKYHPKNILDDGKVSDALKIMFKDWFNYLGLEKNLQEILLKSTFDSFKNYSTKTGLIDERLREEYQKAGVIDKIHEKLKTRANSIYKMISPFVNGSVLDIGCGPGEVAQMIHDKKHLSITLTDIIDLDLRQKFAPTLHFTLKDDAKGLPYKDNQFDTSLLITVLHHCSNPLLELEEAARVTKGNIVIVETIYGVGRDSTPEAEYKRTPMFYDRFHNLDGEQQRKYGTFLDWFLNKMIIGNEVNCPYNFNSLGNWEDTFKSMDLELVHKKVLGVDQPATPEYHVLYVVKKK